MKISVSDTMMTALPFVVALLLVAKYGNLVTDLLPSLPSGSGSGSSK